MSLLQIPGRIERRDSPVGRMRICGIPERCLIAELVCAACQRIDDRGVLVVEEIRDLIGAQTFAAIAPYITLSLSPYYTIRAEGRVTGSSVKQIIQTTVQIEATLPGDYRIISWQDGYY